MLGEGVIRVSLVELMVRGLEMDGRKALLVRGQEFHLVFNSLSVVGHVKYL